MVVCQNCGTTVDSSGDRCPNCNSPLPGETQSAGASGVFPSERGDESFVPIAGYISDRGDGILESIESGYKLYAVAGLSQHGKSEFMKSLTLEIPREFGGQSPDTTEIETAEGGVKLTDPGTYYGWRIRVRDQAWLFWDIAGEDFERMNNPDPQLREFLRRVLPQSQGILLCIALNRLWRPWDELKQEAKPDRQRIADQRRLETHINAYAAYLEIAHSAWLQRQAKTRIGLAPDQTSRTVRQGLRRRRLLDLPVLVSFTMADTYCDESRRPLLNSPPTAVSEEVMRELELSNRKLDPVLIDPEETDPNLVARIFFPKLLKYMKDHVRWFKFDFSHAYKTRSMDKKPEIRVPKGCLDAFEFLCRMNWRSRWMTTRNYWRLRRRWRRFREAEKKAARRLVGR